jgi:hypothetical protein
MKNKNLIKIKKVSEERYFKSLGEVYTFTEKMYNTTIEHMCDTSRTMPQVYNIYENEILKPLGSIIHAEHTTIRIGNFICMLSRGTYERTSGTYKFNLIAVQKTNRMCHNDMKKIFNYE